MLTKEDCEVIDDVHSFFFLVGFKKLMGLGIEEVDIAGDDVFLNINKRLQMYRYFPTFALSSPVMRHLFSIFCTYF